MKSKYLSDACIIIPLKTRNIRNVHQRLFSAQALPKDVKPFESIPGLSSIPLLGPLHHFLPVIGEIGPDGQLFSKFGSLRAKYGPIMKMAGVFTRANFVFLFEPEHFEQVYRAEETNPLRPGFQTLTYYREEMRQSIFQGVYGLTTAKRRFSRAMLGHSGTLKECYGQFLLNCKDDGNLICKKLGSFMFALKRQDNQYLSVEGALISYNGQGPQWREFRTKVNPALLKPKLIKLYAPGLEEIADDMVARISTLKDNKEFLQQNFELEMTKWSLESIALVGLGARLGCLRDDLTEEHPAMKLMKCAKDIMDLSFKLEFIPSPWRYIPTPNFNKIVKVFDMQWEISSIYVNEAKRNIAARTHDVQEEDKSIIEKLLAIDEKVAIMMANEMLLAGIDTVAFATMATLYHLAANPRTQDILREEIRLDNSSRYLRACVKEALRIWHVVPANLRRTSKDHVVGGYHIPKGIDVIAPNQYLSNLEQYYPRPNEFLPERWLANKDDPIYHGNAHPMINLPFGYGVRSCIGRRIAELEIEIFIKKLIDEFKVTWEGPPLQIKTKLMNSMEKPYRIVFEPAKNA